MYQQHPSQCILTDVSKTSNTLRNKQRSRKTRRETGKQNKKKGKVQKNKAVFNEVMIVLVYHEVSAQSTDLVPPKLWECATSQVHTSASVLAETSVRSPRKLFIFIINKHIFWIKVSKEYLIFNFEKGSTGPHQCHCFSQYIG